MYAVEIAPSLALGFLLSGLVHEFVPARFVDRYLSGKGLLPLLYSAFIGTILPICCIGTLPVALSLHRKGASTGAVIAFLVATPATSISALLVSLRMLGLVFTIYIFFSVIIMGVILGALGNLLGFRPKQIMSENYNIEEENCVDNSCSIEKNDFAVKDISSQKKNAIDPICGMTVEKNDAIHAKHEGEVYYFCSEHCHETFMNNPDKYKIIGKPRIGRRILEVLKFAFITMPKYIGLELLIGIFLAVLVASIDPIGNFIGKFLGGWLAYPVTLVFGLLMYICSTASVPLVAALLSQGLNHGAGMVLLIAGPVTSWGTILVLKTHYGWKMLAFYLIGISAFAIVFGLIYNVL